MKKIVLLFAVFLLAACSKPSFKNVDITGSKSFGSNFELLDPNGQVKTMADFKGKAVLIFFGYTHCPDVCPATLIEMQEVMKALGPLSDRVQVIFITVDPQRDTAELMAQYPPAFDPRFIGLRPANDEALAKLAKDFKMYVCGITPYDATHLGHAATYLAFDLIYRYQMLAGKNINFVENITDV
ncbi:MAG: hypothetical protein RLZZ325_689, partial [Pseudomonadota bacterium]